MLCGQATGVITDQKTNEPLEGVNITSGSFGTTSNEQGEFSIDISEGENIQFSFIGYKKIILPATKEMIVQLEKHAIKGELVVVRGGLSDELLQRSSSSVSVLDHNNLKKADGSHFQDVMATVPNLNAAGGTSRPRYFQIRGVGERSHYFAEGPPNFSVGFVMDDIDLSGLGMAGMLYDLDQIEVFKGPQSSIYGPNALAGLISMRSFEPMDSFKSHVSLTGGTDNIQRISGMVNIPLGKMLALRIATSSGSGDGFRKNKYLDKTNTNERKENFIREKLLIKPNDHFTMILTALNAVLDNKYDAWSPDNNEDLFTYTNQHGEDSQKTKAYSLRANYNKNKMNATFITSNSETDLVHAYDGDWGNDDYWLQAPYNIDPNVTGWKYEFFDNTARSRSNQTLEGRLQYGNVVAGYFSKTLTENDNASGWLYGGDATLAASEFKFDVSAAYGQINKNISDKIKLIMNLRKETDQISYKGTASNYYYGPLDSVSFDLDHDLLGGKMALQYLINDEMNVVVSASQGYKAGGVNQHPSLAAENRPYDPEYMKNFELGLRRYTDRSTVHLTGFYAKRQKQQVSISSQQNEGDPNSFVFYTANATTGSLSGLEFDGSLQLNKMFSLNGSLGLLNTHVDEFTFESDSAVISTLGGREAAHAPQYSFNVAVDFGREKGLFVRMEMTGKDKFYFSDSHDEISEPYQLVNGYFGYNAGSWSLKIWGRNILDTRYATRGFYFGLEPIWNEELHDHEYPDRKYVSYGDPAHFGLSLDFAFD